MGNNTLFLHVNVLNYHYFRTDCSTFLKVEAAEALEKNKKKRS